MLLFSDTEQATSLHRESEVEARQKVDEVTLKEGHMRKQENK